MTHDNSGAKRLTTVNSILIHTHTIIKYIMKAQISIFKTIVLLSVTAAAPSCCAQTAGGGRHVACAVAERLDRQTALTATYEELPCYTAAEAGMPLDTATCDKLFTAMADELRLNKARRVRPRRSNLLVQGYSPTFRIYFHSGSKGMPAGAPHDRKAFTVYADMASGRYHIVECGRKRIVETPITPLGGNRMSKLIKDIYSKLVAKGKAHDEAIPPGTGPDGETLRTLEAVAGMRVEAAYLLDPMRKDSGRKIGRSAVIDSLTAVPAALGAEVISLLSSSATYEHTDMVADCAFLPDVAWTVTDGERSFNAIVAFYCGELVICDGENTVRLRLNAERQDLLKCAISCFPTDGYLKKYVRK